MTKNALEKHNEERTAKDGTQQARNRSSRQTEMASKHALPNAQTGRMKVKVGMFKAERNVR